MFIQFEPGCFLRGKDHVQKYFSDWHITRQPAGTVYQRISGLDKNIAFLDYVKCFNYALSHDDDDEVMLNVLRCQLTY